MIEKLNEFFDNTLLDVTGRDALNRDDRCDGEPVCFDIRVASTALIQLSSECSYPNWILILNVKYFLATLTGTTITLRVSELPNKFRHNFA